MTRTVTRDRQSLLIAEGGAIFPRLEDRDENRSVTLVFKPGVKVTTGLHWHELKTEYLQVIQGHARVTLGSHTAVFSADDGVITIPRFTIHAYGRADDTEEGVASRNADLLVREWTDPADGDKEVFFRNLISTIMDNRGATGLLRNAWVLLSLFTIMASHDNYPLIWSGPMWLGEKGSLMIRRLLTNTVLRTVSWIGWSAGCKGDYEEYTPVEELGYRQGYAE